MTTQIPTEGPEPAPLLIAGEWEHDGRPVPAHAAGTGKTIGATYEATAGQLARAIEGAVQAVANTRRSASYERGEMLRRIAELIISDADRLARSLAEEIAKPITDARLEVQRTAMTFRIAGEEAERIGGEVIPLDLLPTARGRWGVTRRMPIGPIGGITPFNVPLSLSAHKLAPALAAGNTIVLKPDSRVALTMLRLATLMTEAGVPSGAVSMLPMRNEVGDGLITDERLAMVSFTGSARAGWEIRARAGRKKVALELGGNAPLIVDETADVAHAVERTVAGAFKYAGQLCISVQRAFVHTAVWDEFVGGLVKGAQTLRVGDPLDEATQVGPMISVEAARQAISWLDEAADAGARILTGGDADDAYIRPAVIENVPRTVRLAADEAFAPVVIVTPFDDLDDAIAAANESPYGLQAGFFTRDINRVWSAYETLDVGALVINDVPTFRVDNMPFGGVKSSGLGREGVRWAIDDMTEERLLVLSPDAGGATP